MHQPLSEQLNVRLAPSAACAIHEAAARECMSPSALVRRIVMRELRISMEPRRKAQNAA